MSATEVAVEELSGREIDEAVAEEVMGWRRWEDAYEVDRPYDDVMAGWTALNPDRGDPDVDVWEWTGWLAIPQRTEPAPDGDPPYEKVVPMPMVGSRYFAPSTDIAAAWEVVEKLRADGLIVEIISSAHPKAWFTQVVGEHQTRNWEAYADAVPEAICRAALKAVRSEPDPPRAA